MSLTIRDEVRWLESFHSQFAKGVPAKFDARLHMDLYGTDSYDHDSCLVSFNRHTKRVMKYFEGREEDLLILDVTNGDGWEKLCPFLDRPEPGVEFPIVYQKHERDFGFRLKTLSRNLHKIPIYIMRRVKRMLQG